MFYNSGVVLSQNVSSIIVPRCLFSLSLVFLEDCSSRLCSDSGILEWVPDGPGIGKGSPHPLPSLPAFLSLCGVAACSYRLLCWMIQNKIVDWCYDQCFIRKL